MGVDRSASLANALLQIYGAARQTILDSVANFDPAGLEAVRADFFEIGAVLRPAD